MNPKFPHQQFSKKVANSLRQYVVKQCSLSTSWDKSRIDLLWEELNKVEIPNLVIEEIDNFWNPLLMNKDRKLCEYFIYCFEVFVKNMMLDDKGKLASYRNACANLN